MNFVNVKKYIGEHTVERQFITIRYENHEFCTSINHYEEKLDINLIIIVMVIQNLLMKYYIISAKFGSDGRPSAT